MEKIIKRIHQIFINDEKTLPSNIHAYTNRCVNTLRVNYPTADYKIWTAEEIEALLYKFDPRVFEAYNNLLPYAYKADLARYCILYEFGGLYVDLNIELLNTLESTITDFKDKNFFAFRDESEESRRSWSVCNGFIYTEPNSPIMSKAIDIVIENVKKKFYGRSPSEPTGPIVLGKAIMNYDIDTISTAGQFQCIINDKQYSRYAFVADDSKMIVALWKHTDLMNQWNFETLRFTGTNNYRNLWANNNVYK